MGETARIITAEAAQRPKRRGSFYIANQVTPEGLDEIQRLIMARSLGFHVALDGPPGVGKTKSVYEAARILGAPLFAKSCSNRTPESHIISHPVLAERNGISVTDHVNGPLCLAMINGGVFYGDEFNLLRADVQKRLNSAFDERRAIDRNDGVQVTAAENFWAVISYNPTANMASRDLEDSVADRFIHFHYDRWEPNFKAYVSSRIAAGTSPLKDAGAGEFNLNPSWRAVAPDLTFLAGTVESGRLAWKDFFTGQRWDGRPRYVYRACAPGGNGHAFNPGGQAYAMNALAMMISRFTGIIQALARTGKSPLLAEIGLNNVIAAEDLDLLSVHESSTRIESAALAHCQELLRRGCRPMTAQAYAVRLVIDQVCYGQFRERKLSSMTTHELVTTIAKGLGLLGPRTQYNTGPAPARPGPARRK